MKNRTQIILATSLMATFLGLGCNTSQAGTVDTQNNETPVVVADGNETGEEENILETESWQEVEEKWHGMDKVKVSSFEEVSEEVSVQKEDMNKIFKTLIDENYLSPVTADAINFVYGENLRYSLEATVDLPCCYEPIAHYEWEVTGIDTREGLENKLALIEELYEKEGAEKEALDAAKKGVEARLSLLDKADEYWKEKGEGPCEEHPKEVDVLLHFFDNNVGKIQENDEAGLDLIKASEFVVILETAE